MTSWLNLIQPHATLNNTMETAAECIAHSCEEGTTIATQHQLAGRGRRGRHWFSQKNSSLTFTTVVYPKGNPALFPQLSLVAGAAIFKALTTIGASSIALKWPNDVLCGNKKLAGILLEAHNLSSPNPAVCIGIGLNLAPADSLTLPPAIKNQYIGLREICSFKLNNEGLLQLLIKHLEQEYSLFKLQGLNATIQTWNKNHSLTGNLVKIKCNHQEIRGRVKRVSKDATLCIEKDGEEIRINAGEVEKVLLKS